MARTKYNSYKQNLVAKHFPLFNEHVLSKITVRNGFSIQEVREYKGKLRAIFIASITYKDSENYCGSWVEDRATLLKSFYWSGSVEGFDYWNVLDCKLEEVHLKSIPTLPISDIVEPAPTPTSKVSYSVQGKDKAL